MLRGSKKSRVTKDGQVTNRSSRGCATLLYYCGMHDHIWKFFAIPLAGLFRPSTGAEQLRKRRVRERREKRNGGDVTHVRDDRTLQLGPNTLRFKMKYDSIKVKAIILMLYRALKLDILPKITVKVK